MTPSLTTVGQITLPSFVLFCFPRLFPHKSVHVFNIRILRSDGGVRLKMSSNLLDYYARMKSTLRIVLEIEQMDSLGSMLITDQTGTAN